MRDVDDLSGTPVFCSWSGGKDSALALHEAVAVGLPIRFGAASWDGYEDELTRVIESGAAEAGTPVGVFLSAYSCGRAIRRWSSASSRTEGSTPCSSATSRSERPDSAAALTMSAARS